MYKINFPGFNGATIEGLLALPAASASVPGLASFHGYDLSPDGNIHEVANLALHGYGVHHMFVRGQQGNSVDNVVPSHGFAAGWMTKGIQKSEEYYFRAVYMYAVRAVDTLLPGPNK